MSGSGSAPQLDERALEVAARALCDFKNAQDQHYSTLNGKRHVELRYDDWSDEYNDEAATVIRAYRAAVSGAGELDLTDDERAFVLCRADAYETHIDDRPLAVYVGDREACKADLEHRQSVNPNSHYYAMDVKLNPKSRVKLRARLDRKDDERDG